MASRTALGLAAFCLHRLLFVLRGGSPSSTLSSEDSDCPGANGVDVRLAMLDDVSGREGLTCDGLVPVDGEPSSKSESLEHSDSLLVSNSLSQSSSAAIFELPSPPISPRSISTSSCTVCCPFTS